MEMLASCCLFTLCTFAGDVLVVDRANGPGTDFLDLGDAVTAAADGDTLLVRQGIYDGATIDGKGLHVIADQGAEVVLDGLLVVQNLPATSEVVLRSLESSESSVVGFRATGNGGAVWVENCTFRGRAGTFMPFPPTEPEPGARVHDSAQVVFTRCTLNGGPPNGSNSSAGAPGLTVKDSVVVFAAGTCAGTGGTFGDDLGGFGGSGVLVSGASDLFVSGSTLIGGDGGGADSDEDPFGGGFSCGIPGSGGSGVEIASSSTSQVVLLDNTAVPGAGGFNTDGLCSDGADGEPVLVGFLATPPVVLAGSARTLRVSSPKREAEPTNLVFVGEPSDLPLLLVGAAPAALQLPGILGSLNVDPAASVLPLAPIPATGFSQLPVLAPTLPAGIESERFYLQSLFVSSALELVLSSPTELTVLDASF